MSKEKYQRKEKLVTELPQISHKTVMGVIVEIALEPKNFIRSVIDKMLDENPGLADIVIKTSFFSPQQDYALLNAAAVYECFSQEANKRGEEMIKVSDDVIRTHGVEMYRDVKKRIHDFMKVNQEVDDEKLSKSLMGRDKEKLRKLIDENPELDHLFAILIQLEVELLARGEPGMISLNWAFDTYELLKAQAEANKLKSLMES